MSKDFCRHLQNGLVYNNNTSEFTVAPCCYFATNGVLDPSDPNIGQTLKDYRQKWLNSDLKTNCKICLDSEAAGMTSYRQASFDHITEDGDEIEFLTVAVNKKCNLACASCGSHSSSRWYRENRRNNVQDPDAIIELHLEDKSGSITQRFMDALRQQDLQQVRYIKFGGGEPLMNDAHLHVLNMIPDPSKVILQYTSNFTVMPASSAFNKWREFRMVKWMASIDAVGDKFEFLRWPARWQDLEDFIARARAAVPHNVVFGVEHTINPLNVAYYKDFETWFRASPLATNRYNDTSDLNIHGCNGVMDICRTPQGVRDLAWQRIGERFHPVLRFLHITPYCGGVNELVTYLDQLDTWRSTDWRSIFPEVQDFFHG